MLREAFREQKLAKGFAGIFGSQERWKGSGGIVFHWQHDVVVAQLLGQDDAADIFLVQTLHDDHDG